MKRTIGGLSWVRQKSRDVDRRFVPSARSKTLIRLALLILIAVSSVFESQLSPPQIQARMTIIAAAIDASVCTLIDLMGRIYISNFLDA